MELLTCWQLYFGLDQKKSCDGIVQHVNMTHVLFQWFFSLYSSTFLTHRSKKTLWLFHSPGTSKEANQHHDPSSSNQDVHRCQEKQYSVMLWKITIYRSSHITACISVHHQMMAPYELLCHMMIMSYHIHILLFLNECTYRALLGDKKH